MTIKLTIGELLDSVSAMQALLEVPMPAATAFKVKMIAKQMNEAIEPAREAIEERRQEYIDDENQLKPDKREEWEAEIEELVTDEIVLRGETVNISALGTAEIRPTVLFALDWLINDGSQPAR
jgi:hypothetical protein